jgi:MFS family permease
VDGVSVGDASAGGASKLPAAEPERSPSRDTLPIRFWAYLASRCVSVFGDGASLSALAIFVYQRNPSTFALAGLFAVRAVPRLLGPITGHLSDRMDLRALMRACDLAAALIFGIMALTQPPYLPLIALVFLAELAAATSIPATRTATMRLVPKQLLGRANSLVTTGVALGLGAGAAMGGLVVATVGAPTALAIDAGSFVVSALLVGVVPPMPPQPAESGTAAVRVAGTYSASIGRLWSRRGVAYVSAGVVVVLFTTALDRPALVILTQERFHAGPGGYGLTLAMVCLGVLVSGILLRLEVVRPVGGTFLAAIGLQGLAHIAIGVSPSLGFALASLLVAGVGNGLCNVAAVTLVQQSGPAYGMGSVMGAMMSMMFIADALGSLSSGALLLVMSPGAVFWIAGALMVVCVPMAALVAHSSTREALFRHADNSQR